MRQSSWKRLLLLILAVLLLFSAIVGVSGCSNGEQQSGEQTTASGAVDETEADPLAGLTFNEEPFRILTSTNNPGGVGNSNYLIQGPEEETGDIVNDAAFIRNRNVEELLNIKFEFTPLDLRYDYVTDHVSKLIASAEDQYDLIINDLYPLAGLSLEGNFSNVYDGTYFDFSQNYWYEDYMTDLTIGNDKMFLLAGDYFIDIIRSAHALYFNKNLMENLFSGASSQLYEAVNNGEWTLEQFISYVSAAYDDLNGNSSVDEDDQFGYIAMQIWGPSIPFIMCGNVGFIERDEDGIPSIAVNNPRSLKLLETLNELFHNQGTNHSIPEERSLAKFSSGTALFIGYQRLGSLEDLRSMDYDVGILPYPKLDADQEFYVTSSHDTTEIGVVPITVPIDRMEYISAVLEALNRETMNVVLPAYYETALKVKYTRDDESAQMIDIIHDNFRDTFALAYNATLNDVLLKATFYEPLERNSTDLASAYARIEKAANTKLEGLIDTFLAIE